MADKLSKGSNSSTFKNVSIDIGVIGMQSKATETRKTVILTSTKTKQTNKQKEKIIKSSSKNRFYVNSTEIYMAFERHFI